MDTIRIQPIVISEEILEIWQGNRRLTRRVMGAFPEKELFEFSIGGMRPFANLVKELLEIAVPGLKQIVTGEIIPLSDEHLTQTTKEELLTAWDETTDEINRLWAQLKPERFRETVNLFGQFEYTGIQNITYFIENEIHHRGQGYVYLRALGIQPPFFWER